MKNLFALLLVGGAMTFTSCDSKKTSSESEQVIESDTTDTTYKVEETRVETDTTIDVDTVKDTETVESGESEKKD